MCISFHFSIKNVINSQGYCIKIIFFNAQYTESLTREHVLYTLLQSHIFAHFFEGQKFVSHLPEKSTAQEEHFVMMLIQYCQPSTYLLHVAVKENV
jgi:hypothetical protein